MFNLLFWCMLAVAVVDWAASWSDWKRVRWVTKPGTLILLIAWFTQIGGWRDGLLWFGLGLVFSLLGDVFLQMPDRLFPLGMIAFFFAHGMYITGLAQEKIVVTWLPIILFSLVIALFYGWFARKITAGLQKRGEKVLTVPVLAYAMIISVMFALAFSTLFRTGWAVPAAIMVSLGAGLFYLSDSTLAYNRFVCPVAHANLLVMVTYHLGQILIAAGALTEFAGASLF